MPKFTVHAVVIAHTRFDLELEADSEAAARMWADELLAPHGMVFNSDVWENIVDCDDYQLSIPRVSDGTIGDPAIVTKGIPSDEDAEVRYAATA